MKSSGLRILAIDMDDTLLRSDLTISSGVRNAIKRTEELGIIVVLASGRIPSAMERYSRLLGLHKRKGYLISNNGALIQESHTGAIVHEARIDVKTALAICDLADAEGFPVQMYEDNIMYISRQSDYSAMDQRVARFRQVVVENFRAMVGDGCYKLLVPGDTKRLILIEAIIRSFMGEEITLLNNRPYFLEMMSQGTDKGSALAKVSEITGISAGEVLAIGDSMSDEAMIRWAGIGVAMANGDERIKNIADFVTNKTNDDDGVAEAIDKYFFGK